MDRLNATLGGETSSAPDWMQSLYPQDDQMSTPPMMASPRRNAELRMSPNRPRSAMDGGRAFNPMQQRQRGHAVQQSGHPAHHSPHVGHPAQHSMNSPHIGHSANSPYMHQQFQQPYYPHQPAVSSAQLPQGADRVRMWDDYRYDSGVVSGNSSAAPSIMSGATSMHEGVMNCTFNSTMDATQLNNSTFHELQTPGNGTKHDNSSFEVTHDYASDEHVREAKHHLSTYAPHDQQTLIEQLPYIVSFLLDADTVVAEEAARQMLMQAQKPYGPAVMAANGDLMNAFGQIFNNQATLTSRTLLRSLIHTIAYFTRDTNVVGQLLGLGILGPLCQYIDTPFVTRYCLPAVHNMLVRLDQTGKLRETPHIDGLVGRALHCTDVPIGYGVKEKHVCLSLDIVIIACRRNPAYKKDFLASQGVGRIVTILGTHVEEKVQLMAVKVLRIVSSSMGEKEMIAGGCLPLLTKGLEHASPRLNKECLDVLGNLSAECSAQQLVEEVNDLLYHLPKQLGGNEDVSMTCANTITNLVAGNAVNKSKLCTWGLGVEELSRTVEHSYRRMVSGQETVLTRKVVSSACIALKSLVTRSVTGEIVYGPDRYNALMWDIVHKFQLGPTLVALLWREDPELIRTSLALLNSLGQLKENWELLNNIQVTKKDGSGGTILNCALRTEQEGQMLWDQAIMNNEPPPIVGRDPPVSVKALIHVANIAKQIFAPRRS